MRQEITSHQAAPQRRGWRGVFLPGLVLLAAGCADVERLPREQPQIASFNPIARQQRELEMNRLWQNHTLSELVEAMGKPRMTMNIPGGGNPPSYAVVYGQDERSGCIDAFAIHDAAQPTVRIYHCR